MTNLPDSLLQCPHCGSTRVDVGATGLHQCKDCDGLFREHAAGGVGYKELPEGWTPEQPLPVAYLRETGLLWLINRVVFHPRGFAIALHYDNDRNVTGWTLEGDGSEVWQMGAGVDEDATFSLVEAFLNIHRDETVPNDGTAS